MKDFQPVTTWKQGVGLAIFILVIMAAANRIGPVKKIVG